MKIVTVLGARPQFIKAATLSAVFPKRSVNEILLHTGQHYDRNMSETFFQDLNIPAPKYNLGIAAGNHGAMTGRMLEEIERVLLLEKPEYVLVYGDTNSTLAGALAAAKLHISVAHVEAGLRSFNRKMPEEVNRVLSDHISSILFAPTRVAVENLKAEGIYKGVYHIGDVMYDAAVMFGDISDQRSSVLEDMQLSSGEYFLATIHRAENTDSPERLRSILSALMQLNEQIPVVLPLHPRTAKVIDSMGMKTEVEALALAPPVSYLDMVALEKNAKIIITDSGGVQKEAYFHGVPCVTLRDETEWVETVEAGWNTIAGSNTGEIIMAVQNAGKGRPIADYGNGNSAALIADFLIDKGRSHG